MYDSGIPVSVSTVSPVSAADVCSPGSNSCFLSETPRDAPDGAHEPAAGVQVEEVRRSNVSFQLPGLPRVLVHLHCYSVQQKERTGELFAPHCIILLFNILNFAQ